MTNEDALSERGPAFVRTGALRGIEGLPIDVEVDIGSGLPAFNIVGLPDAAVQEARERVRAAIRNSGFEFPLRRITVNLAPADVRKEGPVYDLPIAVAVLVASGQVPNRFGRDVALFGELSLDGRLRHGAGVLPFVAMCLAQGIGTAIVPAEDLREASVVPGIRVLGMETLAQAALDPATWAVLDEATPRIASTVQGHDLAVVQGQEHVKRALEVAAAGGHNVMMQGPPGSGKTLLARAMPGLLAPLSPAEAIEVSRSTRWPVCSRATSRCSGSGRSALRTTPSRTPASSVGGRTSGRARSRWPTVWSSFSTSSRSSALPRLRRSASRSRRVRSPSPAHEGRYRSRRGSSSSPQ